MFDESVATRVYYISLPAGTEQRMDLIKKVARLAVVDSLMTLDCG